MTIANLDEADLRQFDSLVVTPGLPLNRHPIAQRARAAGVEIIGDIELFARARSELPPHKVVGITGTTSGSALPPIYWMKIGQLRNAPMNSEPVVTTLAAGLPIQRPNSPATIAAISGRKTMRTSGCIKSSPERGGGSAKR